MPFPKGTQSAHNSDMLSRLMRLATTKRAYYALSINRKRLYLTHPPPLAAGIDADAIEAFRIDEKSPWEDVLSDQFLDAVGWDE